MAGKAASRGHSIDQWCGADSINEVKLCVVMQVGIYVRGLVRILLRNLYALYLQDVGARKCLEQKPGPE